MFVEGKYFNFKMKRTIYIVLIYILFVGCHKKKDNSSSISESFNLIEIPEDKIYNKANSEKKNICHISGIIKSSGEEVLILKKKSGVSGESIVKIPINKDKTFNYILKYEFLEAYDLFLKDQRFGLYKPLTFFPDNDSIEFILYSFKRAKMNKVIGSKLYDAKEKLDQQRLNLGVDYDKIISFETNFIQKTTILGYYRFLEILEKEKRKRLFSNEDLKKFQNRFVQKFPNHPYNEISKFRIDALTNIKIGGHYINFTAPNSNEKKITISNYISTKKYVLLDLWTPTCAPCIKKSKKIVPFYKELNKKGFDVVGVLGGIESREEFIRITNKYSYPWVMVSEIKSYNNLWEKYNIKNLGGRQFLVDNHGKILSIDPSIEELKSFVLRKKSNK